MVHVCHNPVNLGNLMDDAFFSLWTYLGRNMMCSILSSQHSLWLTLAILVVSPKAARAQTGVVDILAAHELESSIVTRGELELAGHWFETATSGGTRSTSIKVDCGPATGRPPGSSSPTISYSGRAMSCQASTSHPPRGPRHRTR